ncbi:MATE family efflux transporter [Tissierella sp. P1]|jgi:putative MATE family efflux protein|uniref:MATE family efflux transporter n=1 Tax=unclassified Tissierella TaxID=2638726 RepID=UPI000BA12D61|nr:MATE family efflux transporter [Tissierella sp. P1]OZV12183.1 MATE family efflux transporter [Tissierella sp. P1]
MESSLDKKHLREEIVKIAGPVFIELLMGTLFGMVDMMMLGRSGDAATTAASIAAVGVTNQLVFLGLALVQSLNIGATTMVARYIGAKREDRIESVVKHVMILTQILLVIPILFIGLGMTDTAMKFFGAHEDTLLIGRGYFRVIALGFIFQAFNFSIFASLRGSGDTKTPMKINIISNLLNVVGNAILIYGLFGFPRLGVLGAGISTSLSQVVASILLTRVVLNEKNIVHIKLKKKFKFDKDIIYNLIKIGLPASGEQLAMRAGMLVFTKIIASLGTVAYATHQICISILNLSFTPGQAFGISASTLAGRSLGEEEPDKAEAYIKMCMRIGAVIAAGMGIVFFLFGSFIAGLYTDNQEVVVQAGKVLKLVAFIQPFQCSQLIIAGGLRGAGDTVWTLISTFLGILVIRLIFAYIFVIKMGMGLQGAWLSVLVDQGIRWAFISIRFRTNKWKYITIR